MAAAVHEPSHSQKHRRHDCTPAMWGDLEAWSVDYASSR